MFAGRGRCGLILLLLAWLGGCAYLQHMVGLVADKPEVKLERVEVTTFTSQSIELVFVLNTINTNGFSIDIDRLDYQVSGLGVELGGGQALDPLVLKSKAAMEVRLPFTVNPEVALQLFRRYLTNPKDLKLKLRARIFMNTAFGKMDMQFEEERTVIKGIAG